MDRRRVKWAVGIGGGVVLAGALVLALLPGDDADELPVRARQYTDVRACLLAGGQGVTGKPEAPVWAGMQEASGVTRAQVSWMPVTDPVTAAHAQIFANTLLQQKCSMVLAGGEVPGEALRAVASAHPKVRFVVVGQGESAGNVTVVQESDDVQSAVAHLVKEATQR